MVFFSFAENSHLNFDLEISNNENRCGYELAVTNFKVNNDKLGQKWTKNVFSVGFFSFY